MQEVGRKNCALVPTLKRMYILFKGKHPEVKCSEKLYKDLRSDFSLRFGTPRSDNCQYCDKLYLKLVEARSEKGQNISRESETHHRRAPLSLSCPDMSFIKFRPSIGLRRFHLCWRATNLQGYIDEDSFCM